MTLAKHGVTKSTPGSILMGAGTVYKNLKWEADAWTGIILGATQGGNKVTLKNTIKAIDVDGITVPVKGMDMIEKQEANMDVNLIEINKGTLKTALLAKDGESDNPDFDLIEMKSTIETGDYLDNIAFVGFKTDNTPIIVILENAICTSGLDIDAKPKDGAVTKLTFECRADPLKSITTLPVKIYLPKIKTEGAN